MFAQIGAEDGRFSSSTDLVFDQEFVTSPLVVNLARVRESAADDNRRIVQSGPAVRLGIDLRRRPVETLVINVVLPVIGIGGDGCFRAIPFDNQLPLLSFNPAHKPLPVVKKLTRLVSLGYLRPHAVGSGIDGLAWPQDVASNTSTNRLDQPALPTSLSPLRPRSCLLDYV